MVGTKFDCNISNFGSVSIDGRKAIDAWARARGLPGIGIGNSSYFSWMIRDERGTKIAKRYANYCRVYFGNKLEYKVPNEDQLAAIGQMADKFSFKEGDSYFFMIKKPPFDFPPASYGHGGSSCWFKSGHAPTGYKTQVEMFESLGGMAILFYAGEEGIARLWAWQASDGVIAVFNGYFEGGKNTLKLAELVAESLNTNKR